MFCTMQKIQKEQAKAVPVLEEQELRLAYLRRPAARIPILAARVPVRVLPIHRTRKQVSSRQILFPIHEKKTKLPHTKSSFSLIIKSSIHHLFHSSPVNIIFVKSQRIFTDIPSLVTPLHPSLNI